MPNDFQSIESGAGLLKDYSDNSLSSALKKKREKLAETKLGLLSDDQEGES